jgi:hypothetical protein
MRLAPRTSHRVLGWCLLLGALGGMSCTTPMVAPEGQPEPAAIQSQPATIVPAAAPASSADPGQPATGSGCVPDCTKRTCGSDGCGGSCGTCELPSSCDDDFGVCQDCAGEGCGCEPNCVRRICGSDGCDGSCGTCEPGEECSEDGRCRRSTCGNGKVERGEECDGGETCTDDCERFSDLQIACYQGPTLADDIPGCSRCLCLNCTQLISDCYLSGETLRDAACRTIAECGVEQQCTGVDACICGTQQCRPPNGPCNGAAEEALALIGGTFADIVPCLKDPDCAFYRATVVGECLAEKCGEVCLVSLP